jgi:uncharacterized protein
MTIGRRAPPVPAVPVQKARAMAHRFLELATTDAARTAQAAAGSRAAYARLEGGKPTHDRLREQEEAFIAARDSFYVASVNDAGWPYIQHRGGPPGFLKVLDEKRLGFADLAGNKQYLTLGNVQTADRIALFLMDYPNRRRLKLLGRMHTIGRDDLLMERLVDPAYPARAERGFVIAVEAFDWNCPQHITPRFTQVGIGSVLAPLHDQIARLTAENDALRTRLAQFESDHRP